MLSCSDSATFCHVLSTCQCFHTHPFHEDLRSNGYTSLRILPRFVSLWLLFRRALCQRRPRRRVGCSGQAVPCLVLRRFQQAVLVYMRSCWCMLINGHPCWWYCWIMLNAGSCWSMLMHVDALDAFYYIKFMYSNNAWSFLTAWSQRRCGGTFKGSCGLSSGLWHRIALKIFWRCRFNMIYVNKGQSSSEYVI